MILLLIVAILAIAIIGIATTGSNSSNSDFEEKYKKHNLKIVKGDYPCCDCSYFYDGAVDSYPYVPNEERPHPPCCMNRNRCLEDRNKCYVHDNL